MASITMFDGKDTRKIAVKSAVADSSAAEWMWTPISLRADGNQTMAPMDAYGLVGDIFRGVQIRANAVATMPRHFYTLDGGVEINEDDARLRILGNFPDWLWRTTSSMMFYGASYSAKLDETTQALRWFMTTTITPKWTTTSGLTGFIRSVPGQSMFELSQMLYIWYPSPFTEIGPGVGPARVAMEEAGVVRGVNMALTNYFERGMIQPILLHSDEPFSQAQKDDLRSWFQRMLGGARRAFSLEVAARKLEKIDLSSSLKDAYPPGIRDEMCKSIAKTLGIPFSMLFSDAANYATAQQDEKNFYIQSAIPDCRIIQNALNRQLLNPMGIELDFASDELQCMQENVTTKAQGLNNLIAGGVPVDVAMDAMGYDLDEEDDARIRLISLMKQGASYDAARAYIEADADPLEIERVRKVLDLFAPAKPSPVEQLYTAPQTPPPAPEPPPAEPVPPIKVELRAWQNYAMKRVKAGKPLREFETKHVAPSVAGAIAGALESCATVDDVRAVFHNANLWGQYP